MNTIAIINHEIECSREYIDYIKREFEKSSKKVTNTIVINENDKSMSLIIKTLIKLSETLLIVASKKSFLIAGKILSTLNDDLLEQKDDLLLPIKTDLFDKDSYLLKINDCVVNVIKASLENKLPQILIHKKTPLLRLNLFGIEPQDAQTLLLAASQICHVRLSSCKHIGGWGTLGVYSDTSSDINHFLEHCQSLFPNNIMAGDDVVEHIVRRLAQLKKKITFAESCTGGRIASLFTAISGSSAVFDGSMVTYANEIKAGWLGVNATSLIAFGAVSIPVVEEMAAGALEKTNADYAISVSGVAGPGGGSIEKPVGTVYIAAASRARGVASERLALYGDREFIQIASAYNAIRLLLKSNPELI